MHADEDEQHFNQWWRNKVKQFQYTNRHLNSSRHMN